MTVNQTSDKIAIDWQSFSIGSNESVMFLQPSASASALNNVIGSLGSVIQGTLNANGQVILTNPNGIHINPTANIDVGSLISSTLNISTQDFVNNLYRFAQDPDRPLGYILNEGTIRASDFAALIAPGVENKGIVVANLGTASVVAGEEVTVDFVGDGLINFSITKAVAGTVLDNEGNPISDQINNSGAIQANGGQVILSALSTSEIIKNVVNNEGMIEANTVVEKDGRIMLMGGDQGVVRVSGTLDASGDDSGEKGGTAHVLGEKVALGEGSLVDVSGDVGGGEALIGGDYQGSNERIQNAWRTYVDQSAVINASAPTRGDGGKVIVWADDVNRFYGSINSSGGTIGGDGGFAEVSGKNFLDFQGTANLSSRFGSMGTLLLDPVNVRVVNGGVYGVTGVDEFDDPGPGTASIDADTLDDALASITIQATEDITVDEAIALTTSGASLTLTAKEDIIINEDISTYNGAINLTPGGSLTLTGTVNSGSAATKIELYNGGYISLGDDRDCEENMCTMTLTSTNLAQITSTGLTIGGADTTSIFIGGVSEAATDNVSGTVTLNATGSTTSEIIFGTADDVTANFYALTTNSRSGTYLDGNITILTGDYNGTANSNNDWDETTENGEFVLGTGITLNMSGGGDVSFTGAPIYEWGDIVGSGTYTTNGTVFYLDVDALIQQAIEDAIGNAQNAQFLNELEEMVTDIMGAVSGSSNC
ncbi:MAG: filamentous hemagglutinin N-terminal domain-containing protein [Pseudomonadales bacterium]|nr:filamentous hemagglutinin N-terminal domain-containing protein [Pseudomonadales bacterium]